MLILISTAALTCSIATVPPTMPFSATLLARCSTMKPYTSTSFVNRFQTANAAASFVASTNNELKCEVNPFDEKVVYINFKSEGECVLFGTALAPYMEPAFTPGKGKPAPEFNVGMLPPLPVPTAGDEPIVSVCFFARAGTVIPTEVTVDRTITKGVRVCYGKVPVSAITTEDREDSKGAHKVTIGTSVFSLSTKPEHSISTSHAIKCSEQWQRDKQADEQALEAHVKDCAAVREIFFLRGEYLTEMPHSRRTKNLAPGQAHVLYRVSASTPAPAPAPAQVVAPPFAPSEMELLEREMKALEESNKEDEASIESAIEAKKVAEAKKADEEALVAMRLRRDALLVRKSELQKARAAVTSA